MGVWGIGLGRLKGIWVLGYRYCSGRVSDCVCTVFWVCCVFGSRLEAVVAYSRRTGFLPEPPTACDVRSLW